MFNQISLLLDNNVWALGTNVTVSGLAIVFIALIALVLVISLFAMVFDRKKTVKSATASQPVEKPKMQPTVSASVAVASNEDPDEIIAVIAAAVDAMYSGSGKRAVIRSVRPSATTGRPVWAAAGIFENTRAF